MLGWYIVGDQATTHIRRKHMNKQVHKVAKINSSNHTILNYKFIFSLGCKSFARHRIEHIEYKTLEMKHKSNKEVKSKSWWNLFKWMKQALQASLL